MKITAYEHGPLGIETGGPVVVTRDGNEVTIDQPVIALCRCGHSADKPFCDGSHKTLELSLPAAEIVSA